MTTDVVFFIAAGESERGLKRYYEDIKQTTETQAAFGREFDCLVLNTEKTDQGLQLVGLRFDDPPDPLLWRKYNKARDPNVYCPNKSSPEGKALAERMAKLPTIPTEWQLVNYVMPLGDRKNNRVWTRDGKSVHPRCITSKTPSGVQIIGVQHNAGDPLVVAPMGAVRISGREASALLAGKDLPFPRA